MEAQQQRIQQMILARQQHYANQPQYGRGPMFGAPQYGGGYGSYGPRRRQGGGMGGIGLPLLGGLAGGLLLGEVFDDFGGGDFGGGDFGGGDFGGF